MQRETCVANVSWDAFLDTDCPKTSRVQPDCSEERPQFKLVFHLIGSLVCVCARVCVQNFVVPKPVWWRVGPSLSDPDSF